MRKAFSMIELIFIIVILGIMAAVAVWYLPRTELQQASEYLINNLKYTKTLAQLDDRYYTMSDDTTNNTQTTTQIQHWKLGMWQLQFHNTNKGTSASNSYTVYADQAKGGTTNNFDGIPNDGDIIARDPMTKNCLSGYSLSNLKSTCTDNFAKEVKLEETYQTTIDTIQSDDCPYTASSGFSILFDNVGTPYCRAGNTGQINKLTKPIKIGLKRRGQYAIICVSKGGIIEGLNVTNNNTSTPCPTT